MFHKIIKYKLLLHSEILRSLTLCLSDVIKEKRTSYESVNFQGTMLNKSYQLYGLIFSKNKFTKKSIHRPKKIKKLIA